MLDLCKGLRELRIEFDLYMRSTSTRRYTVRGLGENLVINITVLTHKTTMLMALCSACRGSELSAADIARCHGRCWNRGPVRFETVALTKTKRAGKPKFSLGFEQYSQEPVLDVVSAIRLYVARTEQWRPPASGKSQLFLFWRLFSSMDQW